MNIPTSGNDITIELGSVSISNKLPFVLIAGPCQMEGRNHALEVASALAEMTEKLGVPWIFKSSFDKANRTSLDSRRGIGFVDSLPVFAQIKQDIGCPVVSDVHEPAQCVPAAEVLDMLQIPAFLCRQTDLLVAAGRTGAAINIKKAPFMAPWDIEHAAGKVASTGNQRILLTDRGVSFGYNTLISDMRSLPEMAQTGYPVVIDATHSVQQPGGRGTASDGQREFVPVIARAAVAVGVAAVFMETHPDPDHAPSDGPNMIRLQHLPELLAVLQGIDRLAKAKPLSLAAYR